MITISSTKVNTKITITPRPTGQAALHINQIKRNSQYLRTLNLGFELRQIGFLNHYTLPTNKTTHPVRKLHYK